MAGCLAPKDTASSGEVLLVVNGLEVPLERFQEELDLVREELGDVPVMQQQAFEGLRQRIVQQLIEDTVLEQAAAREGVRVDEAEIEEEGRRLHGEDSGLHRKILRQHYKTEESWRAAIRHGLLREKIARQLFPAPTTIAEEDILEYWRLMNKDLHLEEEIRLSQIVIAKPDEAESLYRKLQKQPGNFEALAEQHSITPEGRQGGDLGWVRRSDLPQAFGKAFGMPPGVISRPEKSPYGFHIFLVRGRRAGSVPDLAEYRPQIVAKIRANIQSTAYQKGMAEMIANASIQIHRGVLARVHW